MGNIWVIHNKEYLHNKISKSIYTNLLLDNSAHPIGM
jgi:hypothetical protein